MSDRAIEFYIPGMQKQFVPIKVTDLGDGSYSLHVSSSAPPGTFTYLRPGGVDSYLRPGGVDTYLRP